MTHKRHIFGVLGAGFITAVAVASMYHLAGPAVAIYFFCTVVVCDFLRNPDRYGE